MNGALIEIEQEKKNQWASINDFFFIDFLREFSRRHGGRQYIFFSEKKIAKSTYVKVNLTRKRNEIAN